MGASEFRYISAKLCPLILVTNDNNSKILRSVPSPSTGIKDLSGNSAARLSGHGWGYLLSFLSNASTLQLRQHWQHCCLVGTSFTPKTRRGRAEHLFCACREERQWERLALLCFSHSWGRRGVKWLCREQSVTVPGIQQEHRFVLLLPQVCWAPKDTVQMLVKVVLAQRLLEVGVSDL